MKVIIHWDHKKGMDHTNLRFLYQYYDYTCRGFGMEPKDFAFVDLEGTLAILKPPNPVFVSLEEALKHYYGNAPVYIHYDGKELLPKFNHPDKAVYIVGPNYDALRIPNGALSVKIPVAWNDLWSHVALGIVLYDRVLQ